MYDFTEEVLSNLSNGLADDGYLINFEPTHGNRVMQAIRSRIYRKSPLVDFETERDYHIKELNKFYAASGYDMAWQFYLGLLTYCLYYNPDVFPRLTKTSPVLLKVLFALERLFYRTSIAKFFSFATLTILIKKRLVLETEV